ncbi:MAG: hypothetical protein H6747_05920 [Deltaproteobacteria bacterium]|nr:hypothetical protein [Deltaproteobacteria bacterium]
MSRTVRSLLRTSTALFGLLAGLMAGSPAFAQGALVTGADAAFAAPAVSVVGAETLAPGERALVVSAGLPDVEVGMLWGTSSMTDVLARLRFQYGRGVRIAGGGITLGTTLRMRLASFSGWNLALTSDPELTLHILGSDHPPTSKTGPVAFGVTPLAGGVVLDRMLLPEVRLALAVQTGVGFFIAPDTVVSVPISVGIAVESKLAESMWLFARIDTGYDLYGPGGIPGSDVLLRARLGLSFL